MYRCWSSFPAYFCHPSNFQVCRSMSTSTFPDKKGMSTTTTTPTASEIDSALLAAVRDDRERVALWRLESTLCEFLATNNTAAWLEVSGPWNSVVLTDPSAPERLTPKQQAPHAQHAGRRLADRFGIVRETGQVLEGSIRLIKLTDSKIPVPLLQDLDASAFSSSNTTGAGATGSSGVDSLSRQMANQTLQPNSRTYTSRTNTVQTMHSLSSSRPFSHYPVLIPWSYQEVVKIVGVRAPCNHARVLIWNVLLLPGQEAQAAAPLQGLWTVPTWRPLRIL
jgi:hypothetical protein